jgi:molybdopterin synthase sulfur carrier subunit
MHVRVRLFAALRKYLPSGATSDALIVELAEGASVCDAIAAIGIPAEHARMITSENRQLDESARLQDGQEISVFPPLAGGAGTHRGRGER